MAKPVLSQQRISDSDVIRMWWLSLGIAAVVVGIVASLLGRISSSARSIDQHAAGIWTVGKQIAGNTVSIWMLGKASDHLARMQDAVQSLDRTAASMDDKLRALAGTGREGG